MTHILQDAGPYTLALNWLVAGDATNVGTVTIGITDAAGTAVVAPSTSTSYSSSTATYSYTLADRADPALLNVTWTRSDTGADLQQTIEVVGSELFNERDARSFDNSKLTSASVYTEAAIAAERIRIGEMFERWTGLGLSVTTAWNCRVLVTTSSSWGTGIPGLLMVARCSAPVLTAT